MNRRAFCRSLGSLASLWLPAAYGLPTRRALELQVLKPIQPVENATPASSWLIHQDFETATTGYDNGETWTKGGSGTIDPANSTSPAPLLGTQSLYVSKSAQDGYVYKDVTSSATVYGFMLVRFTVWPGNGVDFVLLYNNSTSTATLTVDGTRLKIVVGGASALPAASMAIDTTYYLWFEFHAGTGANAIGKISFSTDGTKPTTGDNYAERLTGSATLPVNKFQFCYDANSTSAFVVDKIRLATYALDPTNID